MSYTNSEHYEQGRVYAHTYGPFKKTPIGASFSFIHGYNVETKRMTDLVPFPIIVFVSFWHTNNTLMYDSNQTETYHKIDIDFTLTTRPINSYVRRIIYLMVKNCNGSSCVKVTTLGNKDEKLRCVEMRIV